MKLLSVKQYTSDNAIELVFGNDSITLELIATLTVNGVRFTHDGRVDDIDLGVRIWQHPKLTPKKETQK